MTAAHRGEGLYRPHGRDFDSFNRFYQAAAPLCGRILRRLYGHLGGLLCPAEFDEVLDCAVGDAFTMAWERWNDYDPSRSGRLTWLVVMARGRFLRLLEHWTRHARHRTHLALEDLREWRDLRAAPGREDETVGILLGEAVEDTLSRLSPPHARVLRLRCQEERSMEEIAAALGITVFAVKAQLQRAREAFRRAWAAAHEEEGRALR